MKKYGFFIVPEYTYFRLWYILYQNHLFSNFLTDYGSELNNLSEYTNSTTKNLSVKNEISKGSVFRIEFSTLKEAFRLSFVRESRWSTCR